MTKKELPVEFRSPAQRQTIATLYLAIAILGEIDWASCVRIMDDTMRALDQAARLEQLGLYLHLLARMRQDRELYAAAREFVKAATAVVPVADLRKHIEDG